MHGYAVGGVKLPFWKAFRALPVFGSNFSAVTLLDEGVTTWLTHLIP
jgi:hypothetical protein